MVTFKKPVDLAHEFSVDGFHDVDDGVLVQADVVLTVLQQRAVFHITVLKLLANWRKVAPRLSQESALHQINYCHVNV